MARKKYKQAVLGKTVPFTPKSLRVKSHFDLITRTGYYNVEYVSNNLFKAVGNCDDLLTRSTDGDVLVQNMPPFTIDSWAGFVFNSQENAALACEVIRLFLLEKGISL